MDFNKLPTCPHCGCEDEYWWDSLEPKNDSDVWDDVCGCCGQPYRVVMCVSTSFATEKIVQPKRKDVSDGTKA